MTRHACVAVALLACASCGVEILTTTAIQGQLQAEQMKAMERQVGAAGNTAARTRLKKAIDTYTAEKGYYPPSLDALAPDYIPSVPAQNDGTPFGYDASRGVLLDGPVQQRPSPADDEKLRRIRDAIDQFGRATGYYPASLNALVPQYLPEVPMTEAGQAFAYNPADGTVQHPDALLIGPVGNAPRRPMAPAGAGPMGEAMTGIQMQGELNRMSSGGANRAAGQARQGAGNLTGDYNRRQQRAVEEYIE